MTEPQSVALIREALEAGPIRYHADVCSKEPEGGFVLYEDYAALSADAQRYRTWLAYAFSEEEGTETYLIDTPEKMQEWLDKRAAAARGE